MFKTEDTRPLPTAIDLYSGAGGMSLGMEQAGFEVTAAAELDPVHALTHLFNFPRTQMLHGDLSGPPVAEVAGLLDELAGQNWRTSHGAPYLGVDAVVGGPPCQGFSVGGVRESDDVRNNQLLRFVDLVVHLQPKVFCLENVAGLLEPRFELLRKQVLWRLADGGYEIDGFPEPVNASQFGVPQSRRRVLLFGSRIGAVPSLEVEGAPDSTVADAFEGLPDVSKYRQLLKVDATALRDEDLSSMYSVQSPYARRMAGVERCVLDMSEVRARDFDSITGSLRTVHSKKSAQRFLRTPPGKVEKISRLYRLSLDGKARTLRAGTGTDRGSHTSPRPIHPVKPRVITVREAARLHGFPDWFRFHRTNWHGHRQVGNSVPPPLGAAAGRALLAALGESPERQYGPALPLGDADWLWMGIREAISELSRLNTAHLGVSGRSLATGDR